jgi:hypothetical protein
MLNLVVCKFTARLYKVKERDLKMDLKLTSSCIKTLLYVTKYFLSDTRESTQGGNPLNVSIISITVIYFFVKAQRRFRRQEWLNGQMDVDSRKSFLDWLVCPKHYTIHLNQIQSRPSEESKRKHYTGSQQIPGAMSPCDSIFVLWSAIFLFPYCETCFMSHFWLVGLKVLDHLCTPE